MNKEIRLDIGNRDGTDTFTYRERDIVSLKTDRELFTGAPSVGNCVCGELTAELMLPSAKVPINGKLVPYVREEGTLEWHQKSEFFVFNRNTDEATEVLRITAYDAIYRGEESFTQEGDQGEWPRTDIDVMDEIATRTGSRVSDATRAVMTSGYQVQYPGIVMKDGTLKPDGDGALTMREVAGRVASFYAGNWIIDNNGEWRLVCLGDVAPETNYLVTGYGSPITLGDGVENATRIILRKGVAEPHRLVIQNGDCLTIGGMMILV